MRNKKGMVIGEVLKIILAVLGLLLIAGVAYYLYSAVTAGQDSEIAKRTLDSIEGKISNLEDGETGKFPIKGPSEWILVGYGDSDTEFRPDKCALNNCICICPGTVSNFVNPNLPYALPNYLAIRDSCQQEGFCRKVSFDEIFVEIEYASEGGTPLIEFPKNLLELQIVKTEINNSKELFITQYNTNRG